MPCKPALLLVRLAWCGLCLGLHYPRAHAGDMAFLGQTLRDPGLVWAMPASLPVAQQNRTPVYAWQTADAFLAAAQKKELQVLAKFYLLAGRPDAGAVDYPAFLAAAAERYNQNGIQDAAGLHYPLRYWVIEPEMDPTQASSRDPDVFARFVLACHRALTAAHRDNQVIVSLGSCEYSETKKRLDRADELQAFFSALNRFRDPDTTLTNLVFAFSTLSEPGAFRHFSRYVDFLSEQRRLARLSATTIWCLETGVVAENPADIAVETLKQHLYGTILGIRAIFFWTPVCRAELPSLQPDPLSWMKNHGRQPAMDLFKLAGTLLEWADWDKARIIRSGEAWLFQVTKNQELIYIYWKEKPELKAGFEKFTLSLEKENGPALVYTLSAAQKIEFREARLKSGSIELPVSPYPIFIKINKTDECNCR